VTKGSQNNFARARNARQRAFDAGFDLYLVKPIDFDQLADAIEQL